MIGMTNFLWFMAGFVVGGFVMATIRLIMDNW